MTSVGGHSALRGTVCTRAECPGGHCALGHDVRGDILHGGTSCPPTTVLHSIQIYGNTWHLIDVSDPLAISLLLLTWFLLLD